MENFKILVVDDDRDLLFLMALGRAVHVDAVGGQHLHAHFRDFAVDADPALVDPVVGLAA